MISHSLLAQAITLCIQSGRAPCVSGLSDLISIGIIKNLFIQSHIYLRFLRVLLH